MTTMPASSSSSCYHCLYTKHKTQKRKIWNDGKLTITPTGIVTLHPTSLFQNVIIGTSINMNVHTNNSACNSSSHNNADSGSGGAIDSVVISKNEVLYIQTGSISNLETEKFLIQIEGLYNEPNNAYHPGAQSSVHCSKDNNSNNTAATITNNNNNTMKVRKKSSSTGMEKLLSRKFKVPQKIFSPPPSTPSSLSSSFQNHNDIYKGRKRPLQPGEWEKQCQLQRMQQQLTEQPKQHQQQQLRQHTYSHPQSHHHHNHCSQNLHSYNNKNNNSNREQQQPCTNIHHSTNNNNNDAFDTTYTHCNNPTLPMNYDDDDHNNSNYPSSNNCTNVEHQQQQLNQHVDDHKKISRENDNQQNNKSNGFISNDFDPSSFYDDEEDDDNDDDENFDCHGNKNNQHDSQSNNESYGWNTLSNIDSSSSNFMISSHEIHNQPTVFSTNNNIDNHYPNPNNNISNTITNSSNMNSNNNQSINNEKAESSSNTTSHGHLSSSELLQLFSFSSSNCDNIISNSSQQQQNGNTADNKSSTNNEDNNNHNDYMKNINETKTLNNPFLETLLQSESQLDNSLQEHLVSTNNSKDQCDSVNDKDEQSVVQWDNCYWNDDEGDDNYEDNDVVHDSIDYRIRKENIENQCSSSNNMNHIEMIHELGKNEKHQDLDESRISNNGDALCTSKNIQQEENIESQHNAKVGYVVKQSDMATTATINFDLNVPSDSEESLSSS